MAILIADDHILFRDTLITYLSIAKPDLHVVAVSDFHEIFDELNKPNHGIEFMLVDFSMPHMPGRDGFRRLIKEFSLIPCAMMSGVAEPDDVNFVMSLGARGYIPKTLSGQVLLKAIDHMMRGEIFVPPQTGQSLFSLPPRLDEFDELTPREREVLKLLELGRTNKDIADALDLKPVTVKLHVTGILRKLKLGNRTQAALWSWDMRDNSA